VFYFSFISQCATGLKTAVLTEGSQPQVIRQSIESQLASI